MKKKFRLGVIGGGFMANAIVKGAIRTQFLVPQEIAVSEPNEEKRAALSKTGVAVFTDNRLLASDCDYLLFAVKPQTFPVVAEELKGCNLPVLMSIMAGKTKKSLRDAVGANAKVARIMPNLPCCVGEGMSGIDAESLSEEEKKFVFGLFSSVGKVAEVKESLLNAVTGVSGSGPAYVYLFIKSLAEAAVKEGLTQEQAIGLAIQTVKGGVKMAEESEKSLDELIGAVSSKGGTTVAALNSFADDGFEDIVGRAVSAAVRRAEELAQ